MGQLRFAAVFVHAPSTEEALQAPWTTQRLHFSLPCVCVSVCAIKAPASWEEEEKQALGRCLACSLPQRGAKSSMKTKTGAMLLASSPVG